MMARSKDPTEPIRERAASLPDVAKGTSCNQSAFKAGKGSFLYVGPGPKGVGFKAMFKLDHSMSQARKLASQEPDRFEVGSTGWVTTRFTAEKPLPKSIWEKWLRESYEICRGSSTGGKPVKKKAAKKKVAKKKAGKKKPATAKKKSAQGGQVSQKAARPAKKAKKAAAKKAVTKKAATGRAATRPTLLSGGNPQIAKADGDVPVQAYIAAMPGWKRAVGRRLDGLIVETVPGVHKAVRWNSPFYGMEGKGWFLSYHCFTKYIKITFLNGASLRPLPPVESKHEDVRYFHIHENDQLDEKLLAKWIRQASKLPGDRLF